MKALVLSGGAGFGAYQAGAWRALTESGWRPDIVVGMSIGAVNGFLISHGATAGEMDQAWLELPSRFSAKNGRFHLLPYRRDVARFRAWMHEIMRLYGPRPASCRLQVCMADLLNGAMRVTDAAGITGQHLLAACALPAILAPVCVDGRLYMDGGTLYPVPLKEAVATGATDIVVIDLLRATHRHPIRLLRLTTLCVRNFLRRDTDQPDPAALARARLRVVGHPKPLGTMRECFEWNAGRTERLIETGYRDTAAVIGAESPPAA